MQYRTPLSFLLAVLLGAVVAVVIRVGFVLPGILPSSDIFMFLIDSPLGKFALEKRGGEGGVLIAIALRAFPFSVVAGLIAGTLLRKLRFQRTFCYSALWEPIANISIAYLALSSASVSSPERLAAMQEHIGHQVWAELWIFGWYFSALYISFVVSNRITKRSSGTSAGKPAAAP